MKKLTIDQKKKFLEMRKGGYTIRKASELAGFSYPSGRYLEKRRRSGALQGEILQSERPLEAELATSLAEQALRELERRGLQDLTNAQLLSFVSRIPPLVKAFGGKDEGPEDELDEIYKKITQEIKED
jgi:hypothetical protein